MKTVFYWSPCLSKVGTVKSTLNSALALSKYTKEEYKIKSLSLQDKIKLIKSDTVIS